MSSLHLVLCRGAIALGLALAGVCGGHVFVALSANDAQLRRSDDMSATEVRRAPPRLAQAHDGFPQRTDARVRVRKPARLLPLR
ncbi:MAG: hypothetical protein H7Y19_12935 [Luteimonas sp.]|nr:hypothetical protein [Luteimonas sp.]